MLQKHVRDCTYICHYMPSGAFRGQKRQCDSLQLELQVVVSPCVVLGTKHRSSSRAMSALNQGALPRPSKSLFLLTV